MARTLIRNATIITVDAKIGDLYRGDILIDGTNRIAIPGFIDTHRHTWEALLRNTGPDWTLAQYFTGVRVVMGGLYTPEDNYIGNLLGALDSLDSGVTTLYD